MTRTNERRIGFKAAARRPRIETVTYSMPVYWASYLINGDASSLDDDEIAQADAAIEDIGLGAPVDVGDSEFRSHGDYGRLAGDYADYTFHKIEGASEHRVADSGIDQAITDWNNGNAYRTGSLRTLIDAGLVAWGHGGWAPTRAGKQQGLSMNHLETNETRVVRDFNTLDDLTAHAQRELGATHVLHVDDEIHIYFPRRDGTYEKAEIWQKDGYWHAQGPGARAIVQKLPVGAKPIGGAVGRRAAEARRRGGKGHLPQRYKHSSSTLAPDMAYKLADALSQRLGGTKPKMIEGGYRYSDRNVSAQFTTYSPEHGQKVVVVASVFEDGTTALNFFSDEGLSGTAQYENISSFTYNGADLPEMEKDVRWVWETVDGYAASWQQSDDVNEVQTYLENNTHRNPRRSAHHRRR